MRENDTYEFERNKPGLLEKYEWDDIWFEDADEPDKERVLFLGDSITRGFRRFANALLNEQGAVADQLSTSKSVDNPYLYQLIDYVIAQNPTYKKLHIMFGGHGFHLDADAFAENYEKIIKHLIKKYPDKKIILAPFTPIMSGENLNVYSDKNDVVEKRREKIQQLAQKYALPFTDVYSVIAGCENKEELYIFDGVHFKEEGYKLIAKTVVDGLVK